MFTLEDEGFRWQVKTPSKCCSVLVVPGSFLFSSDYIMETGERQ